MNSKRPNEVEALLKQLLPAGRFSFVQPHIRERFAKHRMDANDVLSILRAGTIREGEWENGEWRYQVHTGKMCTVVEFSCDDDGLENHVWIVTVWRKD